jgi:uncharacterized membrane protein
MRKIELIVWLLVLSSFVVGFFVYPYLPSSMASHWNAAGEADGYMSKAWAVFLMPVVILFVAVLMIYAVRLDPLKKNIDKFRNTYELTVVVFVLFMLYLYSLTLLWNFGHRFNMTAYLAPAFGVLFYTLGILIASAKRNYMIGIRTPWTLANDVVWDKTHKLGGILFRISGIVVFLGLFFPKIIIFLILIPVLLSSLFLVLYSYRVYRGLPVQKKRR